MNTKLVCGMGVNDADYSVQIFQKVGVNTWKLVWICPFYCKWKSMLTRCYSKLYRKTRPTYENVTVCEEWLTFSKFKVWMEEQDYEGKQLDKDVLVVGNTEYSPDTCVFVDGAINKFLLDRRNKRGLYPLGVTFHKRQRMFQAGCNDGQGNHKHIGYFRTPEEAHEAWRKFKYDLACKLANEQTDLRVAEALRRRYL